MRLPGTCYSTAELKSALQKLLRRRDVRAYDVARCLLYDCTSTRALLRRLPIIAVEEGTLGVTSEAVELIVQHNRRETSDILAVDAVLQVIGQIMATPRDKDPATLQGWPQVADLNAWPAERKAAMLWQAWSGMRGREVLQKAVAALPEGPVRDVVAAMQRRARLGVLECDLQMFCGVALALVDRLRRGDPEPALPVQEEAVPPSRRLEALPWWCFDPHVAVGKKALRQILAISPYARWNRAFDIWFRLVSDQLAGYVEREGWRARRFVEEVSSEDRAWWIASNRSHVR